MSGIFGQVTERVDKVLAAVLAALAAPVTGGAKLIAYVSSKPGAIPRTVQEKLDESVSLADFASLRDAINALPDSGGVINIPNGRFPAGVWKYDSNYMAKPNVTLRGAQMPAFSPSADRLVGGSIIEGRFNVFAHDFTVENLGFDSGKYVIDKYYGAADTHAANHPNGDTWDAFAFAQPSQNAPLEPRRNLRLRNVVGLNRDSASVGHAVLIEGANGAVVENVVGMYGIHGVVIKSKNVTGTYIGGFGASGNHVIFKSDGYAHGGNIMFDTVEANFAPHGVAPWSAPAVANYGLLFNPATDNMDTIKVGKVRLFGAKNALHAMGGAGMGLDNLQISSGEIEGSGVASGLGINFSSALNYSRIRLGKITVANMADAVAYRNDLGGYAADALEIESLTLANISLRGIQALGFGRLKIGRLRAENVAGLYAVDDTARVLIGREELINVTTKFTKNAPALTAGWQVKAGFARFDVRLHNYGVTLKGMLEPTGTQSADVVTLPPYLQPAEPTHMAAIARNSTAVDAMVALKIMTGKVTINDGAGINGAQSYLSLSNLNYEMD